MQSFVANIRSLALLPGGAILPRSNRRARIVAFAALALGFVLLLRPDLLPVVLTSLSEAYLQVAVFVAGTLLLIAWSERASGVDVAAWLAPESPWRLGAAALLGALPGCGGAVVVVTRYVAGRTTFGAFVAVLTSTMGDAAFLLLAREPVTGLAMMLLGLGTGILTGAATERFLPDWKAPSALPEHVSVTAAAGSGKGEPGVLTRIWHILLVPGAVLAVLGALQVDLATVPGLAPLALGLGVAGALLAVALWVAGDPAVANRPAAGSPASDTAMVTVWVIAAFLLFGLVSQGFGVDVPALFDAAWMALPLLGVLVGFLPGCGPQIVVATFYLSGVLPVSALAANAISNDGDALFPALALAPRAALAASIVTALPALLVGYALHMALPVP
jgi:hypothetical protein